MTDDLIARLSSDLKPVRPMAMQRLLLGATLLSGVVAVVAMLALLARGVRVLSRDGRCLTAREVSPDVALRYGAWERMSELRHTVRRLKVKETRRGELQQSWREISAAVRACSPDARARVLQTIA